MPSYVTPVYPYRRPAELDGGASAMHPVVVVGAGPVGLTAAIDLALRGHPVVVLAALRQWRVSLFAGIAGASASLANVTALALAPASQVRTLILIEVVFSYFVSRRVFHEPMNRRELAGIVLIMVGVVLILWTTR